MLASCMISFILLSWNDKLILKNGEQITGHQGLREGVKDRKEVGLTRKRKHRREPGDEVFNTLTISVAVFYFVYCTI